MNWASMWDMVPLLLDGAWLTLQLLFISGAVGLAIAVPVSIARVSKSIWLNGLPRAYVFFFRGTPLLVQLFLVYYGLGQFEAVRNSFLWPVLREAYWCAILTFSLHTGAYITEILRGAIQAIPVGEIEAAKSMGLRGAQIYRKIIFPRVAQIAIPAYGNELILMLKASALASTITLMDLTGTARTIYAKNYLPIETFLTAGIFYLVLTYILTQMVRFLEWHFHPELKMAPSAKNSQSRV